MYTAAIHVNLCFMLIVNVYILNWTALFYWNIFVYVLFLVTQI